MTASPSGEQNSGDQKLGFTTSTLCPKCRYDLAGLPDAHTCPECGLEFEDLVVIALTNTKPTRIRKIVSGADFLPTLLMLALMYWKLETGGYWDAVVCGFFALLWLGFPVFLRKWLRRRPQMLAFDNNDVSSWGLMAQRCNWSETLAPELFRRRIFGMWPTATVTIRRRPPARGGVMASLNVDEADAIHAEMTRRYEEAPRSNP